MGKILGMIVAVLGCFSLGLWTATIISKFLQKPGPPQIDECKKSLKVNLILGWVFLALSLFAFSPLQYDPIPLKGFSTLVSGFILLGISGFFLTYRNFRLQVLAVMALAREHGNKLTNTQIMEHLNVGEERANVIIKYLQRNKIMIIVSEEGTIAKEVNEEAKEKKLDNLREKLRKIPGERECKLLRELRALRNTFREKGAWTSGVNEYSVSDISSGVEELFNSCVYSLERVYELWSADDAIQTETTKKALQNQRDEIVNDVQKSVEQLGKTLIDIQNVRAGKEAGTKLAGLRDEMKQRIEIAKKVSERMQMFQDIGGGIKDI